MIRVFADRPFNCPERGLAGSSCLLAGRGSLSLQRLLPPLRAYMVIVPADRLPAPM